MNAAGEPSKEVAGEINKMTE